MKAVNLIPSEHRGGAANLAGSSEGGAFIVLGLMAGLAVLALLYGVAHHQISSRDGQAAKISAEASAAQAQAQALAPYTSFVAMRNERQQAISQLVESRFDWAHAFHELGRVLPYDVSLTSVHGSTAATPAAAPAATTTTTTSTSTTSTASAAVGTAAGGTPTSASASAVASATPPGTAPTFTLVGCATSQSEVAQMLTRLRLVDGVSDVELQSSTKAESSSGSSSGGGSGECPTNDPSFTVQITFAPLPTPSATSSSPAGSAASTADTSATSSSTTTTTTAAGGGS
jgi:Tfp pilus assembly protein PilN